MMQYGHFDDAKKEYVITTPKTPYPWINYLGNEHFFGLISNTAGGYCFYRDARMRRLTRYRYNNVPIDQGGRYFYIYDQGDFWTPGWMPVKRDLDKYECRHGLGYTSITGSRNGIEVNQTAFVPLHFQGEVHRLIIKNTSMKAKSITLYSFVEFCLWEAYDDMTNFQRNLSTGEVEIKGSAIYHKTEYRERRNHFAFFSVNHEIDGFDTDRETFLGLYNGMDSPQVVTEGKAKNSVASGWSPIGSHEIRIDLQPGEEIRLNFILGYVENPEEQKWEAPGILRKEIAETMMNQFATDENVTKALDELAAYWDALLGKYQIISHDEKLNRMVNIWNPYQCMVTFNMSRSASYFESGIGRGMGFRDSNQDLLGFVHQIPSRARERILDIAATQFPDGSAYHQYQPLTKRGNSDIGSGFNDDPLWLIIGVAAYLKETGDYRVLEESVPFNNDVNDQATLFEHLTRSFQHVIDHRGPHGLPLIGRADWNDCLNLNCFSQTPGESFQTTENRSGGVAESVFIAGLFVYAAPDYIALCEHLGHIEKAQKANEAMEAMIKATIAHGYDGDWFLRAYDFFGNPIGSHNNEEGQIFIEPQGFCVMAGIGIEEGLAARALTSVEERLDTRYGIVLQNPPYSTYHPELGEISSYPPGYKENSGIFCHNNPWIMIAETVLGHGDRAFALYQKIAPAYLEEISEIHRLEPYIYAQMIAGKDAIRHGEAKNSWLTGTAAWNYVAITQAILGIQPTYEGLKINPCIPSTWDAYSVSRQFRGCTYQIEITNPNHVCQGIHEIRIDGQLITGDILPLFADTTVHNVHVILG